MNKHKFLILILFAFLISSNTKAQDQLSLSQMQEDFDYLSKRFKEAHQGLYFYADTISANQKIDSLRATLSADLDKRSFFNKISALVALTNEGHTNLEYPKSELKRLAKVSGFLPLGIFFCDSDQKAIIKSVYDPALEVLKGKRIRSINGKSLASILEEFLPYIATDGFNETSAYEWTAWQFPFFYYQLVGAQKTFKLELEDIEGNRSSETIKALDYKSIRKQSGVSDFLLLNGLFKAHAYKVLEDSIAYVTMVSFSGKDKKIISFYERIFNDIKRKGIKHLILDIQRHIGGSEGVENLLASYLFKKPFQKYREVTAPKAAYQRFKNKKSTKLDQWSLIDGIPKRGDYTLLSNYYSEHKFQAPARDLIFDGSIYVLTSGVTFSGGAEFASMLKMQNRAIFIGEEVGGAHEGNVSGSSQTVRLQHSKISISLPIVHFKMNTKPKTKGHGVKPDHYVPQSWEDLNKKVNSKLEFTLQLIKKSNT